jgi:hypothetical protein
MTSKLTNEDKIDIINQHKKNLEYSKYYIQISLLQENSIQVPEEEKIKLLNNQMLDVNSKIAVLEKELLSLQ